MFEKTRSGTSVLAKLAFIGAIVLVLMVPLQLIKSLIAERESRSVEVAEEIGELWSGPQRIAGPVLSVPVQGRVAYDASGSPFRRNSRLYVLPDDLEIESTVETLERRRGMYETAVYTARLVVRGRFRLPPTGTLGGDVMSVDWQEAVLSLGVSELRGLSESPTLKWRGRDLELDPLASTPEILGQGVSARVPLTVGSEVDGIEADGTEADDGELAFEATLAVRGSGSLYFLPLGRETRVDMTSDWPDPSFQGAFLPSSSEIRDDGFTASWSIPSFARDYPQHWIPGGETQRDLEIGESAFGLEWLVPVDFYQQTERCVKYGLLFLTLTFATFFLFELLNGLRIHPLQYLMVGFAMCLFYQLLLAVSEHVGFEPAYLAAVAATVGLITSYSASVLRTRQRAGILGTALVVLYGVLFVLVRLETYTLLVGSVGLFAVLAAFMYLTRRIDWYEIGRAQSMAPENDLSG